MSTQKFPWMQFNTGDWLKDPRLSMCLPATRGIWIDAIAAMHECGRSGSLSGSPEQLSRVLRCTEPALMAAIDDLQTTGTADLTLRNGVITMVNRRMLREQKERTSGAERQKRLREKGGGSPERWTAIRVKILERDNYTCQYCGKKAKTVDHIMPKSKGGTEDSDNLVACCKACNMFKGNRTLEDCGLSIKWKSDTYVTPNSHYSDSDSSSPLSEKKKGSGGKEKPPPPPYTDLFHSFWIEYPRHENPRKAREAFAKAGIDPDLLESIIAWLAEARKSEQWQDKSKIPHPTTFLNQRRWEGDPPPPPAAKQATRDTVGLADAYQPPDLDLCERCAGTGRVLVVTGDGQVLGRAPWSAARQIHLAGPGEKTHTFRCSCPAGRNYMHLEPEPMEDIA